MSPFLYITPVTHDTKAPGKWAQDTLADLRCSAVRVFAQTDGGICCQLDPELDWEQTTALAHETLERLGAGAFGRAGLGTSNFVAVCAARLAETGALHVIAPGQEVAALAALPVSWLPGVSATAVRDLHALRVFTGGELAAVPASVLSKVFGRQALGWQALARGGETAVFGATPRGALPTIRATLAQNGHVVTPADVAPLVEELAAALQLAERAAAGLLITIGFADNSQSEKTVKLPNSLSAAHSLLTVAWPVVTTLLRARRRRPAWIAIAATRTTEALIQLPLPLPLLPAEREQRLNTTLTLLQARFGREIIGFGTRAARV